MITLTAAVKGGNLDSFARGCGVKEIVITHQCCSFTLRLSALNSIIRRLQKCRRFLLIAAFLSEEVTELLIRLLNHQNFFLY